MTALRVAVSCVAILLGACGEARLIGVTCGPDDCAEPVDSGSEPPCLQLTLPTDAVRPGDPTKERCVVFSLQDLPVLDGTHAFLNAIKVESTPSPHDLDLRIAGEAPTMLRTGEQGCAELLAFATPWAPVMVTTDRLEDSVGFGDAKLVISRSHYLLVIDSFTNLTARPVQAGATVSLYCEHTVPKAVSQPFEMTKRGKVTVPPFMDVTVTANCTFQKDVLVSRLYRRTRLIRKFTVSRLHGDLLWDSDYDYQRDFDPPLEFETGQGFEWSCRYINDNDTTLDVGGTSPDACSLFGLYRLPDGSPDPSPEHCVL